MGGNTLLPEITIIFKITIQGIIFQGLSKFWRIYVQIMLSTSGTTVTTSHQEMFYRNNKS